MCEGEKVEGGGSVGSREWELVFWWVGYTIWKK